MAPPNPTSLCFLFPGPVIFIQWLVCREHLLVSWPELALNETGKKATGPRSQATFKAAPPSRASRTHATREGKSNALSRSSLSVFARAACTACPCRPCSAPAQSLPARSHRSETKRPRARNTKLSVTHVPWSKLTLLLRGSGWWLLYVKILLRFSSNPHMPYCLTTEVDP